MPELPEVETTRRGIEPFLVEEKIKSIEVRQPKLRWPVPEQVQNLVGQRIEAIRRRGKYLIFDSASGHLIWHLGMSGSMRILPVGDIPEKHEHIQLNLTSGNSLRYRDPRRFGALLFTDSDPLNHPLIATLGPEPLSQAFNTGYLSECCKKRQSTIKSIIMDSHIVVGVGNIYACESLFKAGINPKTRGGRISRTRLEHLVNAIKTVLAQAITQGGTTLQDFTQADGKPGYFSQSLNVYGQDGPCPVCRSPIRRITLAQRSTYYCPVCQR